MRLYDLTQNALSLMDMLYSEEISEQAIFDTFESVEWEIEEKADNYAKMIKSIEADCKSLKEEEDRLSARRKVLNNKIDFLESNLEKTMVLLGKTDFKTVLFSFKIQKSPPSVKLTVDDETFIKWAQLGREEFLRYKAPEINKVLIKDVLASGEKVFGAELVQNESLRIR